MSGLSALSQDGGRVHLFISIHIYEECTPACDLRRDAEIISRPLANFGDTLALSLSPGIEEKHHSLLYLLFLLGKNYCFR